MTVEEVVVKGPSSLSSTSSRSFANAAAISSGMREWYWSENNLRATVRFTGEVVVKVAVNGPSEICADEVSKC